MAWERIQAGDIVPGDEVARARTHRPTKITGIRVGPKSIALLVEGGARFGRLWARPRKTALWWRWTSVR